MSKNILLDGDFCSQLADMLNDAYGRYVYTRLIFELTGQIPVNKHLFCRQKNPAVLKENWKIWINLPGFWAFAHLTASNVSILSIARLFDIPRRNTPVSFATIFKSISEYYPQHLHLFDGLLSWQLRVDPKTQKNEKIIAHSGLLQDFKYNRDSILAHADYKKAVKLIRWRNSEEVLEKCYRIIACIDQIGGYQSRDFRETLKNDTVSQTEEVFRRFRQYAKLDLVWKKYFQERGVFSAHPDDYSIEDLAKLK